MYRLQLFFHESTQFPLKVSQNSIGHQLNRVLRMRRMTRQGLRGDSHFECCSDNRFILTADRFLVSGRLIIDDLRNGIEEQ